MQDLLKIFNEMPPEARVRFPELVALIMENPDMPLEEIKARLQTQMPTGFLTDEMIKVLAPKMIVPFIDKKISDSGPSYGLEPSGYTARLDNEYITSDGVKVQTGLEEISIQPGDSILAATKEVFTFPQCVEGYIWIKSTWARKFIFGSFAPIEPGFTGKLTLSLHNASKHIVDLKVGFGIVQIKFFYNEKMKAMYKGNYCGKSVKSANN